MELHEKKFCFKGKNLKNSIIEDFRFSVTGYDQHTDLEFPALFQEVTAFYHSENELQIVGYSILEHLPQERINELFSFNIDGKELAYDKMKLPFVIFNDQEAENWQLELMKIVLTENPSKADLQEVEETVEEAEEEIEEAEKEPDGLSIHFIEGEKPVVTRVLDGEKTNYLYQGEIEGTMTFADGDNVIEYDTETETLKEVN